MSGVPGGFTMGRDDGEEDERPAHPVSVKPFFMDTNEVTNEQYCSPYCDEPSTTTVGQMKICRG
jgi:formylglycine-generating enzyme required for sulfatase activity